MTLWLRVQRYCFIAISFAHAQVEVSNHIRREKCRRGVIKYNPMSITITRASFFYFTNQPSHPSQPIKSFRFEDEDQVQRLLIVRMLKSVTVMALQCCCNQLRPGLVHHKNIKDLNRPTYFPRKVKLKSPILISY